VKTGAFLFLYNESMALEHLPEGSVYQILRFFRILIMLRLFRREYVGPFSRRTAQTSIRIS
jgi:hypothetical protein